MGIDNSRPGRVSQEGGNPEPGVRMGATTLGKGSQDMSQEPRVHIGIHMRTPFPQKDLQGPDPVQGYWGDRSWHLPPAERVQFLPEEGGGCPL